MVWDGQEVLVNYGQRLGHFWMPSGWTLGWIALGLPALYFWQTLIHEGSHAVAALFATGSFPKLAPYAHVSAVGFRNGVAFTGGNGFVATPQFVDLVLILVFTALFIWAPVRSRSGRFILTFLYLGVCIDLGYNTIKGLWGGSGPASDWGKFQAEIGDAGIIVLSWLIWLIILSHFLWVYYSTWHNRVLPEAGFWDFRWIVFAFSLASLSGLLFAALVSDPSIDKGHWVFITYVIMQAVAVVGYSTYFGLSFRQR